MNSKIEVASRINFFGDMIGSPVFILISGEPKSGKTTVAKILQYIIPDMGITEYVVLESIVNGAEYLIDEIENEVILYPDIIIIDDWELIEDYEYIKNRNYFTVVTIKVLRDTSPSEIDDFNKFDYIINNQGSKELLETTLTGIVKDLFRKENK
jgi:hypothetical protein